MRIAFLASFAAVSASTKDQHLLFLLRPNWKWSWKYSTLAEILHSSCIAKKREGNWAVCFANFSSAKKSRQHCHSFPGRAPFALKAKCWRRCDVFLRPLKSPQKFRKSRHWREISHTFCVSASKKNVLLEHVRPTQIVSPSSNSRVESILYSEVV